MVSYRYKYKEVEGCLSVIDVDINQRLTEYWNMATPLYLIDELVLMLFTDRKKILSVDMNPYSLKTPEALAALNNLSEIYISLDNKQTWDLA